MSRRVVRALPKSRIIVLHIRQLHPIKTDQHSLGDELIMWDTVEVQSFTLSHDMPCRDCGHARHRFLPCDSDCDCRAHEVAELLEVAGAR